MPSQWYENDFVILMQMKLIITRKVLHLASFWKWEFWELRNGQWAMSSWRAALWDSCGASFSYLWERTELGSYISGILGEISLKVFLSVLNFLLLKKCKGFTNYDEIHNFERKLNLRHTTLENKLHNRANHCPVCWK